MTNTAFFRQVNLILLSCILGSANLHASAGDAPSVTFAYTFGTPHRLTVALPDSSGKTLLDAYPGRLEMQWTYEDLVYYSFKSYSHPVADWKVVLTPTVDGQPFARSAWERADGFLPILENTYRSEGAELVLEIAGASTAAVAKITLSNSSTRARTLTLNCEVPGKWTGYNPAWVDHEMAADHLLAGWKAPADQVVILGVGADEYPLTGANRVLMKWNLGPGERKEAWLIRPYKNEEADVAGLRRENWTTQFVNAHERWTDLLHKASRLTIPDAGVQNAFYACLADLFIMREPMAKGYLATVPGTDVYRAAPNSFESAIVTVALDQLGLHSLAELGYRVNLDLQAPDGDWSESKDWGHLMWGASGFKSWMILEHYLLSGDRAFLERRFPQMLACSRWQEKQRARTRVSDAAGRRPLTYGLMPRGMGDAGLMDGEDLYGVFYAWNIWAVYADRLATEAAKILDRPDEARELDGIYERGKEDLLQALNRGAITEPDGTRWISAVPGKATGSRYGVLNAAFPTRLLEPRDPLITGTLKYIEANMSPGGIPIHTGWMKDGMWVAITLDNIAETHLVRDEGDTASKLLYATLNHGTPLYTWCEERGQEPNTTQTSGDRQHLWTPVSVVRFIRDALVMEDSNTLHLARGIDRSWLGSGKMVSIENAKTHFGTVSYELTFDKASLKLAGNIHFPSGGTLESAVLHCRLPSGFRVTGLSGASGGVVASDGTTVVWNHPKGVVHVEARIGRPN